MKAVRIRMTFDGKSLHGTLDDTAVARDFAKLLPLNLRLEDYARTEKIATLSRRLATEGAPPGVKPSIGDITYYAPWGNLAIFYREFEYADGLVKLGHIESDIELLQAQDSIEVGIERLQQ
jgi:hypothetical protein